LKALLKKAGRLVSRVFLRGLVIILPFTLTVALFFWLATSAENLLGGLIQRMWPGQYWPGLGILAAVLIIFAAGLLMHDPITRWLLVRLDALLQRIPLVKTIYLSIGDIASYMSQDSTKGFKQVVAVRVQDMRLIGFVTTEDVRGFSVSKGENLVGVYLPMSYGIGGYTVYLPKAQIEPLDMSLQDAMRLTLIGGVSGRKPGTPRTRKRDTEDT
jgi:uncharacterized membrane protein